MRHLVRAFAFVVVCAGLWWVLGGEAKAGWVDQGAGWLIGLIMGAAGTAGGVAVSQRVKQNNLEDATLPPVALPDTASSIAQPQAAKQPYDIYKIWYATNRTLDNGSFTAEISDSLRFGDCRVLIPRSHKFGQLKSPRYVRAIQRMTTGSDDALRIVQRSDWTIEDGPTGFVSAARAALAQTTDQILVYIHGYNVSFDDALLRAAQIGFDLKVPGIVAAFCWASRGATDGYMADEDTIKLSARHLADFLALLHANFADRTINIMAHSMGNRALLDVLETVALHPGLAGAKFGQIFLAAPDIDARIFRAAAAVYPRLSARTTLYMCSRDRALELSGHGHGNFRTGFCPPHTVVEGIDTIEATSVSLDMLGHSYYAEAASVLYDMASLLRIDLPPAKRPALAQAQSEDGAAYWVFRAVNA